MDSFDDIKFKPINRGLGIHTTSRKVELPPKIYKPHIKKDAPRIFSRSVKTEDIKAYIKKATPLERTSAFAIDLAFIGLFFALFVVAAISIFPLGNILSFKLELSALFLFIYIFYFAFLESFGGQTLGKKIQGIQVVREKVGLLRTIARILATPFFFLYISEKSYLQDWSSKSTVVKAHV